MEHQQPVLKEITAVKNPRQAFFITDHQIVINGESGCSIVDLTTNTEIKKISDTNNAYLAIHPNKSVFALTHHNDINIYDAKTGTHRCDYYSPFQPKLQTITSAVFNNSEDIFVSHKQDDKYCITHFIHQKNCYEPPINETIIDCLKYCKKVDSSEGPSLHNIICHPTKKNFVCLINNNTGYISITYDPHEDEHYEYGYHFRAANGKDLNSEYSPDGSLLACCNPQVFFIIDIKARTKDLMFINTKNKVVIQAITFHPEGSIIAALSDKEGVKHIDYWDIKNKKIIMSTTLPEMHNTQSLFTSIFSSWFTTKEDNPTNASLSFSPDKKNLMVIMENRCFLMPVALGIVCRTDIQETAFLYWLFNNYQIDHNTILIDEIRQLITRIFLETLKR
jgi:hypothetical protein